MKVNDAACPPPTTPLDAWMLARRRTIEQELDANLPNATTRPAVVHEAMRYACLNGGKRLRAILTLGLCEGLGADSAKALRPALAVELFHASTLVHDDLPCMDDDDLRRGKPATHIRFGQANALLAGNAMLTLAFEWLGNTPVPPPHPPGALVSELSRAGGSQGVIGGQVEDLIAERQTPDLDRLLYIHTEKTARLIACASRMGAICAGACASEVELAGTFGLNLGLAFQILDDILDDTQPTEVLGKPAKSDAQRGKLTSVTLWGLDKSREQAQHYTRKALESLEQLEGTTDRLKELTEWMLVRRM